MKREEIAAALATVVVFRGVKHGPAVRALEAFLRCRGDETEQLERYADFVDALYGFGYNWSEYLRAALTEDENRYVVLRARGEAIPAVLEDCVREELKIFQTLSDLTPEDLGRCTGYTGFLPGFQSGGIDLASAFYARMENIRRTGYGMYARHGMFRVEDGEIVPVQDPDTKTVTQLIGYARERQELIENTRALLAGLPAANALLIGDAGTGKSSSVKAVANLLAPEGLRLIELKKDQIPGIPRLMERLRDNPLKFILFVDDLSFAQTDDSFNAMKAILEGSASRRAANTVIYATSNRRHLVKERFSDREGDDLHRNDTIQDTMALSDRFGLTILFTKPAKALYLEIVHALCRAKGIPDTDPALDTKAAAFALRQGGMTPRAAEQFTDSLLIQNDQENRA